MWTRLYHAARRLWQQSQRGAVEPQAAKARARFWAEVREGQREAEAHSRPWADGSKRRASEFDAAKIEGQKGRRIQ
jgi:hypothetical protein